MQLLGNYSRPVQTFEMALIPHIFWKVKPQFLGLRAFSRMGTLKIARMDTQGGQVVLQQKALQTTLRRAIGGCACAVQYIHVEFAALTCLIGWGRSAPERSYPH